MTKTKQQELDEAIAAEEERWRIIGHSKAVDELYQEGGGLEPFRSWCKAITETEGNYYD